MAQDAGIQRCELETLQIANAEGGPHLLEQRVLLVMRLAILAAFAGTAAAHNGYTLSSTGGAGFAGTRVAFLSATSTEFDKLANGVTLAMWLRFNDVSAQRTMLPISINQASGCDGCSDNW